MLTRLAPCVKGVTHGPSVEAKTRGLIWRGWHEAGGGNFPPFERCRDRRCPRPWRGSPLGKREVARKRRPSARVYRSSNGGGAVSVSNRVKARSRLSTRAERPARNALRSLPVDRRPCPRRGPAVAFLHITFTFATVWPVSEQLRAVRLVDSLSQASMVRWRRRLRCILPPSPRTALKSSVAMKAGGSAGPLLADPLFLSFAPPRSKS